MKKKDLAKSIKVYRWIAGVSAGLLLCVSILSLVFSSIAFAKAGESANEINKQKARNSRISSNDNYKDYWLSQNLCSGKGKISADTTYLAVRTLLIQDQSPYTATAVFTTPPEGECMTVEDMGFPELPASEDLPVPSKWSLSLDLEDFSKLELDSSKGN